MSNKQLSIVIIIIVLLVIVIGAVVYFRNSEPVVTDTSTEGPIDTNNDDNVQHLVVTHAFGGTEHEYTGSVILPTPCHSLEASAIVAESFPEQITITLTTIAPPENTVCTQVLERATFALRVTASEGARLMRVVLDEKPIDFELFEEFKG